MVLIGMARLSIWNFALCSNSLRNKVPLRRISTTRRLMSQEWQQHGIPGSNLPFSIKNKYLLTLKMAVFFSIGFNAPYIIMLFTMMRINTTAPVEEEEPTVPQQLTTEYCE